MTTQFRRRLCQTLGHWIIGFEDYYDNDSGELFTRWRCPVCGRERVSRSQSVQIARDRQRWLVVAVVVLLFWLPITVVVLN